MGLDCSKQLIALFFNFVVLSALLDILKFYVISIIFLAVTRSKSIDLIKRRTNRNVFSCCVFGPPGVGKVCSVAAW